MDDVLTPVAEWLPHQRWYAGKGSAARLRGVGEWRLPAAGAGVLARTLLLVDESAHPAALYQVPVTVRSDPLPDAAGRLIGRSGSGDWLYDGVHDPAYTRALLELVLTGATAEGCGAQAWGEHRVPASVTVAPAAAYSTSVFAGEQSNTSIVYRSSDATPVVVKLFRPLHHGDNPDVMLQTALSEAGSRHVPASVGAVAGEWVDPAGVRARGHLAFVQEFIPHASDAWKLALALAGRGHELAGEARRMGQAVANVHRTLAVLFGSGPTGPDEVSRALRRWRALLADAIAELPALAEYRAAILAVYDRAARSPSWPDQQRIHGDLHLGQLLHAPGREWMLVDFEGEPLRPLAERVLPDVPLRDVAGMLRSFDYAAGAAGPQVEARDARAAFVDGYAQTSGTDVAAFGAVLDAYELDKAVYEALYEYRHRPDWLRIPMAGIRRLVAER